MSTTTPSTLSSSSSSSSASTTTSASTTAAIVPKKVQKTESGLKSFLSGGVGGICVILVGHPLDLIKVRMQTAATTTAAAATTAASAAAAATAGSSSTSVLGMMTSTLAKEGISGLYRGVSAPLIAVSPLYAVSFWGYDMGQRIVSYTTNQPISEQGMLQKCIAGGISAFPCTLFMVPSERIKCLMQINVGKYSGTWDCFKAVYKEGGIGSLYKGTLLTLMRDVPGSIAWFGTYEFVKHTMIYGFNHHNHNNSNNQQLQKTKKKELSPIAVLTAGGFAGMACWFVSLPADVLKSRYQTSTIQQYPGGITQVFTTLIRNEGYGALFTGIRPAMIRAFPANAACFMGMEMAKKMLAFMD